MTSRRRLEEEIARTKDLVVRKQLQELRDKREQRQNKTIEHAKEIGDSLLRGIEEAEPVFSQVGAILWIGVVLVLILIFLEWILGA